MKRYGKMLVLKHLAIAYFSIREGGEDSKMLRKMMALKTFSTFLKKGVDKRENI